MPHESATSYCGCQRFFWLILGIGAILRVPAATIVCRVWSAGTERGNVIANGEKEFVVDPGEQTTGTRDERYDLISVLYHALKGADTCNMYALDAEAAGDEAARRLL